MYRGACARSSRPRRSSAINDARFASVTKVLGQSASWISVFDTARVRFATSRLSRSNAFGDSRTSTTPRNSCRAAASRRNSPKVTRNSKAGWGTGVLAHHPRPLASSLLPDLENPRGSADFVGNGDERFAGRALVLADDDDAFR